MSFSWVDAVTRPSDEEAHIRTACSASIAKRIAISLLVLSVALSGCATKSSTHGAEPAELRFVGYGVVESVGPAPQKSSKLIAASATVGGFIGLLAGAALGPSSKKDEDKGDRNHRKSYHSRHHRHNHGHVNADKEREKGSGVGMLVGAAAGAAVGGAVGAVGSLFMPWEGNSVQLTVRNWFDEKSGRYELLSFTQPVGQTPLVVGDRVRLLTDGVVTRAVLENATAKSPLENDPS